MKKITDKLWISGQPSEADFDRARQAGVTRVINNRVSGEADDQPALAAARKSAKSRDMDFVYIPMTPGVLTEDRIRQFQSALEGSEGPVLAHCRLGGRSLGLWAAGEVLDGRMTIEDLDALATEHGADLGSVKAWLTRRASRPQRPDVAGFFDKRTSSIQYVVWDPATKDCAIIDPVLDFDEKSGATGTQNADKILAYVAKHGLKVQWILDTHPHADHFSAARYLKEKTGAPTAIGEKVVEVQKLWKDIYNWPDFPADGSQWDKIFAEGETFKLGGIDGNILFSPGHTLASITYVIGDAAFVHDTLFMPDSGTARTDFPGGSAARLWHSIQAILGLPDDTRIFTGHDYQPDGREPLWESTVAEQKAKNTHISKAKSEAEFVAIREARDKTLPMPKLILHSLQVNMNGGRLPEPESNGRRYLKLPLDALGGAPWDTDG